MSNTIKTKKGTELPLSTISGKDYIEVCYRIVWFREEHPDWSIHTEIIQSQPDYVLMKAIIKDEKDRIISMAFKAGKKHPRYDLLEKAETGAIGRALARCGYSTAFSPDDTGEDGGRG